MLRDYFSFSRSERRALGILLPILVVLIVVLSVRAVKRKEALLEASVTPAAEAVIRERDDRQATALADTSQLFSFNPNTADSATLRALGLSQRVTSNILKYRQTGARFRQAGDLARIYGMDSATFAALQPYICIPTPAPPVARTGGQRPYTPASGVPHDTDTADVMAAADTFPTLSPKQANPYQAYMSQKLHEGEFLDLNRADTAALRRIPGVGSYYAAAIVNYRRRLGGYTSLSQLQELSEYYDIDNLPDNIGDWLTLDPAVTPRTLNVNEATLKQLKEHPYIGYYRAKAILDLRKREGKVVSLRQLSFLDAFTDEDIARLAPYLTF